MTESVNKPTPARLALDDLSRPALAALRAVLALRGGCDADEGAALRQMQTDGMTAEEAQAALADLLASGWLHRTEPATAADVIEFRRRP